MAVRGKWFVNQPQILDEGTADSVQLVFSMPRAAVARSGLPANDARSPSQPGAKADGQNMSAWSNPPLRLSLI